MRRGAALALPVIATLALAAGCSGSSSPAPATTGTGGSSSPATADASALSTTGLHVCSKIDIPAAQHAMGSPITVTQDRQPGDKVGVGSFKIPTTRYVCEMRAGKKPPGLLTVLDVTVSGKPAAATDYQTALTDTTASRQQQGSTCTTTDAGVGEQSKTYVCTNKGGGGFPATTDVTVIAYGRGRIYTCGLTRPSAGAQTDEMTTFCTSTFTQIFG